jgi:hypothetical protein
MKKIIRSVLTVVAVAWGSCASAAAITDTVTVNGTTWAQVDLFGGLSWNDINAVCPGGICGSGTLNGFDMAGWIWAGTEETNSLFNHYIGIAELGPGPDAYVGAANTFADAFFADGWRITSTGVGHSKITEGWTSDSALYWSEMNAFRDAATICAWTACNGLTNSDEALSNDTFLDPFGSLNPGAWFVSSPSEVPLPAAAWLFGSALMGLGILKRKKA